MKHRRVFLLGAVALVRGRIRDSVQIGSRVQEKVESLLLEQGFFQSAPFDCIGLILRIGEQLVIEPKYQSVNQAGELPISIELDMKQLRAVSSVEVERIYTWATLEALLHVASTFDLPCELLRRERETFEP